MTEIKKVKVPHGFLEIRREWCKGCNLCVTTCPKSVLALDDIGKLIVEKPEKCIGCGMCETMCPDYAIRVNKNE